ncbi:MAG: hypothetical protein JO020_07190 [Chloroflexi bacterium]|nr:hypothetical protein [Chloroflexota bacterium]
MTAHPARDLLCEPTMLSELGQWIARRPTVRLSSALLAGFFVVALTASAADARSIRQSTGYTGRHTHVGWAGPGVGLIAWSADGDFTSYTSCGSSWADVSVDTSWNSSALHNGAELHIVYWVARSDGQHFPVGTEQTITKAAAWPGHPVGDQPIRARIYTPNGTYLKSAGVMSWIKNGTDWPPFPADDVTLKQWTKSC